MPPSCPICEQPLAPASAHCGVCGFPTALAIEGLRSAGAPVEDDPTEPEPAAPRAVARPRSSPEAELNATIARAVRDRGNRLRALGRDLPDVGPEMREAALSEAAGRVAEALEILRGAQGRFERQAQDAVRRRSESVAERRHALERTGLRLADEENGESNDLARDSDAGLERLVALDRRLGRVESDWRGLQGLLAQIESLRTEAVDLGIPVDEASRQLADLRERIAGSTIRASDLDRLAELAAQILMLLHEAVPTSLDEELLRHRSVLDRVGPDRPRATAARKLHDDARRHLERGRLNEAAQSVRDLRREIEALEAEARAPAAPPAPAPAPPPPDDDQTLDLLLKKARSLAARVRTLPADSEIARGAAVQIREATELLREHKFAEADRTLTDLMRSLSSEESGG